MNWVAIAPLTLCFTPIQLPAIESGVFAFATHQNCCNHDASLANKNPCCLLHQPIKSVSLQAYQWFGLQTQTNINITAVNSQPKRAYALGVHYQQMLELKQMHINCGLGLALKSHILLGLQLNGSYSQWLGYKGHKLTLNLACQWQINKHSKWIALLEQTPVLNHESIQAKALPILSLAFQKQLNTNLSLQINMANSKLGVLKIGGHIFLLEGNKQWVFSLSDNLQQTGLALKYICKKHWNWGLGCLYHWQLGLSSNTQLTYAF